jgi:hypothetical protein
MNLDFIIRVVGISFIGMGLILKVIVHFMPSDESEAGVHHAGVFGEPSLSR